ncbi:MAG TPA: AMP-binding protein [Acidimicrobiales bacterium]|nr:AMP-binding protein [Acidimicrobiales bacterium]HVB94732.1 AMP-binding protein [Acidimicrobiales bacterium]
MIPISTDPGRPAGGDGAGGGVPTVDSSTPSVAELLLARADDDHPGLRFEEEQWSWRQVVSAGADRAAWIRSVAGPGPLHIGVLLGNVPEYAFWLGAAALGGAAVVGINATRRGDALAGDIRRTDCRIIVTDTEGARLLEGLELGLSPDRVVRVDSREYAQRLDAHQGADPQSVVPGRAPTAASLFLLLFTSGTTGAPKAVRCTQGRLASIALRSAGAYGYRRDDVAYCTMPLFHGNALMVLWGPTLVVGATVALARRFSASGFLADVRHHRATTFTYVGKALAYVLATPEAADDADTTLRRGFGTEASIADHSAFEKRFGCVLTEGYGSSEGGVAISRTDDTPAGSLGRPPDGVAVVDPGTLEECPAAVFDAGGALANGELAVGEIVNRAGIGSFEGYYGDPEATAARTRHGWYWTGDLAYRDQGGFLYFAGRSGDWMRVDSENLAAGPIERVLIRFGAVAAVAVYPVADPRSGDQVMAALEMLPGRPFDPAGFGTFLAGQPDLGTKWAPSFVRIATGGLPQTASGKVTKGPLRTEGWWEGNDPVFRRGDSAQAYVPMDEGDRHRLMEELRRHGRDGLVGG